MGGEIDYYDIAYCLCKKLMEDKPISKDDCSDIAMILVRSLDILKMKGYTIDKVYDCIESVEEAIPGSNTIDKDKGILGQKEDFINIIDGDKEIHAQKDEFTD